MQSAVVLINLALIFYTVGVFAERKQGTLKPWHLAVFWGGLVFDTLGTTAMSEIAENATWFSFHGITGLLAIVLMLFHALWASWVLFKNRDQLKHQFHKFSLVVWLIWLVPFVSGAIFGMM